MKNAWFLLLSVIVFGGDQLTKGLIRKSFAPYESISVIGDFFRITYVQNLGAGFSFTLGSPEVNRLIFSAFSLVAVVVLTWLVIHATHRLAAICYSLIIGGALGNLADRLTIGGVTDFLDFDFPDFLMQRWPVFNLADSAIVVGITLYVIFTLFIERKTNIRRRET